MSSILSKGIGSLILKDYVDWKKIQNIARRNGIYTAAGVAKLIIEHSPIKSVGEMKLQWAKRIYLAAQKNNNSEIKLPYNCDLDNIGEQSRNLRLIPNRDKNKFENPDELNVEREDARQHISFGFGIHRCLGNRLADLQLKILWEEILKRFSFIETVGETKYLNSSFIRGITELPVIVHRK